MIDRVVDALRARAEVSEYAATEITTRRAIRTPGRDERDDRTAVVAAVFHDDASGRGDAVAVVQPHQLGELSSLIGGAIARAKRSRGPSWRLPAPAAPARVDVFDGSVAEDPVAAAFELAQRIDASLSPGGPLADAAGETLRAPNAAVAIEVARTDLRTSTGFHGVYEATRIRVQITLSPIRPAPEGGVGAVRLDRRRREDLALDGELVAAAERLRARRGAKPIDAGQYDVALSARSIELAAGDGGHGWFCPLVAQADGATARRGLSRYLPGQSIFGDGDERGGDPISITSDGTLPYAPRSLPFAEHGAPVRRFAIVDAGKAAGLALDMREAALADGAPNGGVRNLVVEPGSLRTDRKRTAERPLLEVSELSNLHVDPQSGDFAAEIALGSLDGESVTGATILGNLYAHLATARLSTDVVHHGWYHGPTEIHFTDARIV